MKIKTDVWKKSGKWYTSDYDYYVEDIEDYVSKLTGYNGMIITVNIIEEDGFEQPYRMYEL